LLIVLGLANEVLFSGVAQSPTGASGLQAQYVG
jgi:hypothetical protein